MVNQIRAPESSANQNRVLRQVVQKSSDKTLERCSSMKIFSENRVCTSILIIILVFVYEYVWVYFINIEDCYMNTIDDMQNEMDFYGQCKKFEYNHDFVIFF